MNLSTITWQQGTWQQGWELIGWTMCYFLVAGTTVALLGALVRIAMRRLSPTMRYAYSLAVFTTLAALPLGIAAWLWQETADEAEPAPNTIDLINVPVATPQLPAFQSNMPALQPPTDAAEATIVELELANSSTDPIDPAASEFLPRSWSRFVGYLPWVWLLGTPLTFALLATGLIGSDRLRKQSTLLTEGPIHDACRRLCSSLAVSRRVGVAVCERIASPLLVGVVRPLVLLPPSALAGWTPDELEMVLLHELAHVRRWDNLVNLLQRLVESLLFFHPAIWWVSRWVRRDREECCDAVVVRHTSQPQAYAELLVALATPASPLAGLAMAQHPLAERVRRILQLEDEKMLVSRGMINLAGLALATLLVAFVWVPLNPTEAVESKRAEIAGEENTTETENTAEDAYKFASETNKTMVRYLEHPTSPEMVTREVQRLNLLGHNVSVRATKLGTALLIDDKLPKQILFLFPANTEERVIQNRIRSIEVEGLEVHIRKNGDGSMSVSGVEKRHLPTPAQPPPALFFSLEDQRAADLAYKLLGLELEPLNEEDLERVKTLGYDGGLRVDQNITLSSGKAVAGNISYPNDLLIGLHVWPVKTLQDVAQILRRDDLAELSPLKFYAIRSGSGGGGFGGGGFGNGPDKVVTGRIHVNIAATSKPPNASPPPRPMLPANPPRPAATVGAPQDLPRSLRNELRFRSVELQKAQSEVSNAQAKLARAQALAQQAAIPEVEVQKTQQALEQAKLMVEAQQTEVEAIQRQLDAELERATQILYDGKTFDQWRSEWKNELKTEKRIEAIKALAAFGHAGYGQEAAEAILEIAAAYDWISFSRYYQTTPDAVKKLDEILRSAFIPSANSQVLPIDKSESAIAIANTLRSSDENLKYLVARLIHGYIDEQVVADAWCKLVQTADEELRRHALVHLRLHNRYSNLNDDMKMQIRRFLLSEDSKTVEFAIGLLVDRDDERMYANPNPGQPRRHYRFNLVSEFTPLLFDGNPTIRALARAKIDNLYEEDAATLLKSLTEIIHDTEQQDRHIEAIRAIAAMEELGEPALPLLHKLLDSGRSEVQVAAANAVNFVSRVNRKSEDNPGRTLLLKALSVDGDPTEETLRAADTRLQTEAQEVRRPSN